MEENKAQRAFDAAVRSRTEDLMGITFDCICGETHNVPIRHLSMGSGVIDRVHSVLDELGVRGRGTTTSFRPAPV